MVSDEASRRRRERLSLLQRQLAGAETRSALREQLTLLSSPSMDTSWRVLDLQESDRLRGYVLDEYRQRQSAGTLQTFETDSESILRDVARGALTSVKPKEPVLIHFQQSDTVGLVEADPVFLAGTAVDLLKFDGDNVLLVPRDARWGVLLDRTLEADGRERFEFESWGINLP